MTSYKKYCPASEGDSGAGIDQFPRNRSEHGQKGSGGEAIVKLRIAEALQGKRIVLLPVSEGGMNLKTTNINRLIETLGVKSLSDGQ